MFDYPIVGSEVDAWKEGMYEARRLARSVGISPDNGASSSEEDGDEDDGNDDDSDNGNSWFYYPFQYHGNKFGDQPEEDGSESTQLSIQSYDNSDEDDISAEGQCFSG